MCRNKNRIRSEKDLIKLTELITQSLSFNYKTISDAKKRVNAGIYSYEFDATTLSRYNCNLNYAEERKLDKLLRPFYIEIKSKDHEAYKELCERRNLLFCLLCAPELYKGATIQKCTRPDFILTGGITIGVEITELTTEFDKRVFALAGYIEKRGLDSEEAIKQYIQKYHKDLSDRVEVITTAEQPMISSGMHCLTPKRKHFAEEIKKKYDMYKDEIHNFDEFIILANAASGTGLEISSKEEVQEVIDYLLSICPEIVKVTTIIAWRETRKQQTIIYSWYKTM